jgi:hypothetical protein
MKNANELRTQDGVGTATLQRPRFTSGLLLEDEDLTAGVTYTRDLIRLLMRSLFGCGVICGLDVTARRTCNGNRLTVTVGGGIGLDCMGNAIEVPQPHTVRLDFGCDPPPTEVWVTVCYHERCCRPRDVTCSDEEAARAEATRVRAGYEIKLHKAAPECGCGCLTPEQRKSGDKRHGCCSETEPQPQEETQEQAEPEKGNPCKCYTDHYKGICESDCCGCACIVIGRITLSAPPAAAGGTQPSEWEEKQIDRTMVRKVRPMLNGFFECLDRHRDKPNGKGRPEVTDPGTSAGPAEPASPPIP